MGPIGRWSKPLERKRRDGRTCGGLGLTAPAGVSGAPDSSAPDVHHAKERRKRVFNCFSRLAVPSQAIEGGNVWLQGI
ncbi:hypothetical protein DPSP01_004564 [Paraphaeosphaeria sporulosa]